MGLFSKKKKSILDFISEDLNNIDFDTFDFIGEEINTMGGKFKRYKKRLAKKEVLLFDILEVIVFETGSKNMFFKTGISGINKSILVNFINDLVSTYGKDSSNEGRVNEKEVDYFLKDEWWIGRTWDDSDPTVSISIMRDKIFELSIVGID